MFTLSSTATKLSVLAFSAFASLSAMDSVALGFQHQADVPAVAVLPAVTIVGRRADLKQDAVQFALNSKHADSIAVS